MTLQEILNYPYDFRDCDAHNIKEYFHSLLHTLWLEGEGFSGKRPFGNSGWEYDLYIPLIVMDAVDGKIDEEYGDLISCDNRAANKLVFELIAECFKC